MKTKFVNSAANKHYYYIMQYLCQDFVYNFELSQSQFVLAVLTHDTQAIYKNMYIMSDYHVPEMQIFDMISQSDDKHLHCMIWAEYLAKYKTGRATAMTVTWDNIMIFKLVRSMMTNVSICGCQPSQDTLQTAGIIKRVAEIYPQINKMLPEILHQTVRTMRMPLLEYVSDMLCPQDRDKMLHFTFVENLLDYYRLQGENYLPIVFPDHDLGSRIFKYIAKNITRNTDDELHQILEYAKCDVRADNDMLFRIVAKHRKPCIAQLASSASKTGVVYLLKHGVRYIVGAHVVGWMHYVFDELQISYHVTFAQRRRKTVRSSKCKNTTQVLDWEYCQRKYNARF